MRAYLVAIAGCLAAIAGAAKAQPSVLDSEPALQKPLHIWQKYICIESVVLKCAKATQVKLSVSSELRHEKLCVLIHDMAAKQLLNAIADLANAHWERTECGYILRPSSEKRHQEHDFVQMVRKWRRQFWQRWITSNLPSAEDAAQTVQDYLEGKHLPENVSVITTPLRGAEEVLSKLWMSCWTPNLWNRFWQGEIIQETISTDEQVGNGTLPPAVIRVLLDWVQETGGDYLTLSEEQHQRVRVSHILLLAKCSIDYRQLHLGIGIALSSGKFVLVKTHYDMPECFPLRQSEPVRKHPLIQRWSGWSTPAENYGSHALLQNPVRMHANDNPPHASVDACWQTSADWFEEFAKQTGMNVIADAFRHPFINVCRGSSELKSGAEWLRWFQENTYGWLRIEGSTLLFRHWNYPELRQSEIPEEHWQSLSSLARQKRLTLTECLKILTPLTSEQLARMNEGFNTLEEDIRLFANIGLVRLLGSLTPYQLRLAQTEGLPVVSLSQTQRLWLASWLTQLSASFRFSATSTIEEYITPNSFTFICPVEVIPCIQGAIPPTEMIRLKVQPLQNTMYEAEQYKYKIHYYQSKQDVLLQVFEKDAIYDSVWIRYNTKIGRRRK